MIEVEARGAGDATAELVERLVWTCGRLGLGRATLGLMVVGPDEMAAINGEHRGKPVPTDVLAFPVDGPEALDWPADGPPPELGDVVICPDAAEEPLTTLAVHGLLHLLGYDHEVDGGEMLALQDRLVAEAP
ncbi:rRNA maturation RNase YbeY [Miltoncostaea marina]|uniref:rRNA maturation RNase YbeY n=1 Tax=Miltoncostaea marina TaxID=2843215 RepID=UPI001C3D4814|nr:rRNA maturation RNase YbeY [Miltoncostaea marina]